MAYVNLHDIPIDLFIKYFMNNKIDNDVIDSNSRYQPQYQEYQTNKYYQYCYNIDNTLNVSVNMPVIPEYKISSDIAKMLFNYDQNNTILKAYNLTNNKIVTLIPSIDNKIQQDLIRIQNNEDLKAYLFEEYSSSDNIFSSLSTIYTGMDGKMSTIGTPVYYLNFQNPIARYMHNLSLYPYFGEIYGRYFYSIKKENDTFYYYIDETNADENYKKYTLTSWFDNQIIIKNELEYDNQTRLYYYPVFNSGNTTMLCGKIYQLQPYRIIKYNSETEKYIYTDTYTNTDIEFSKTELPLSPIMKYYNNISTMKQYASNDVYYKDSTKYNKTNYLYYSSTGTSDNIGFAFKYMNIETNNCATGMMDNVEDGTPISTMFSKEVIQKLANTNNTLLEELNDIVSWFNHDSTFDISHNTVYSTNGKTYISITDTPETIYRKTKPMTLTEVKYINTLINKTDYDYLKTATDASSVKTLFSTNSTYVIHKQAWEWNIIGNIQNITENGLRFTIDQKKYNVYKKRKARNINFLAVESPSPLNKNTSYILNDETTKLYYYEISTENSNYYLKIYPLSKYLIDTINLYTSSAIFKYGEIKDNLFHTYIVNAEISNSSSLVTRLAEIHSDCTLGKLRQVFRSLSAYIDNKTSISAQLSDSSSTLDSKMKTVLETIYPAIIENKVSDTYSLSQTTDRFTMYNYMNSLFNNLIYTITPEFIPNKGGACTNKYTNNSYIGFINYSDMDNSFIYSENDYKNNTTTTTATYELSDIEIETIKKYVENKNPLTRLFNYKQYSTNAEEINDLIEKQKHLKAHQQVFSSKLVGYKTTSTSTIRTDSQQVFDVSDLVKKSLDLYTEYLFSGEDKNQIDQYTEIATKNIIDSNVTDQIEITPESEIQNVLDSQAFYRKDIKYYLYKLLDSSNDYIYTNNVNNYELKYSFQNNDQDTTVFKNALKRIQGEK